MSMNKRAIVSALTEDFSVVPVYVDAHRLAGDIPLAAFAAAASLSQVIM